MPSTAPAAVRFPAPSAFAAHWRLDPDVVFLNHGSFGALPRVVCQRQREIQDLLHAEPVRFFVETLPPLLDDARRYAAAFVGAPADGFAFVPNATAGVNAVVRSLTFDRGDEILTSSHEYNACNNVVRWAEERWGVKPVFADVPFPIQSPDEVVEAYLAAVTPRTKLVLISHITSATGIILPVDRIVAELNARGIDTLVDGAHAPGMISLKVADIGGGAGPAYYTGNFHKWCCAPNGAAFLYVRADRRDLVRPNIVSHGANAKPPATSPARSRFHMEMDYLGTMDYSPWLCVPEAIRFNGSLLPGGWEELRARNRRLALAARDLLCRELGAEPPAPDEMLGTMACVPLPDRTPEEAARPTKYHDALQDALVHRHAVQVPIIPFAIPPRTGTRYVRVSANVYNTMEQYEYLARALKKELHGAG